MPKAKLMLHSGVLKNFRNLPVKVQKRMAEFIQRFQENPADPGLHVHALKESMADPKVRGANLPGGYRAILVAPDKGDTHLLVHVDKHDGAYKWAKNKRFEVHEMTGVFQVFDVDEVEASAETLLAAAPTEDDYAFGRLTDEDLFRAGVPQALIPAVRAVRSDDALDALVDYLPPDSRDVLVGLAAGLSLDEALDEMLGLSEQQQAATKPDSAGDFTKIENSASLELVLVEGEEHLKDILEAPLEAWRIFLHPSQRRLVEWETSGPMNITGAAGTGKTVAIIHRAVRLARRSQKDDPRILVTTFTTNLPAILKSHIRKLGPEVERRVEVTNLHALARAICRSAGWQGRIATQEELDDCWEEARADAPRIELPMAWLDIQQEHRLVIDPNGIEDEEAYLTTVRSGRPRLGRTQRRALWPVFRALSRALRRRNLLTYDGAVHQARLAAEQCNFRTYDHVLVDEVQDFSLEALRLIRAISPIDEGTPDPLCTAGDGHQRIYVKKIPMSRAGIDIRGRSRRLKINYRTSEQIRRYAQGMLQGVEIDDLDGGAAVTTGDHSVFTGPIPLIVRCADRQGEAETIHDWVRELLDDRGLAMHEICVTPAKGEIIQVFNSAGLATFELKPREEDPGEDESSVRLGSIPRIKGLEFRAVALACADSDDPIRDLENAGIRSRCERYVAATRAREYLLVTVADA